MSQARGFLDPRVRYLPADIVQMISERLPHDLIIDAFYDHIVSKLIKPEILSQKGLHTVLNPLLDQYLGETFSDFLDKFTEFRSKVLTDPDKEKETDIQPPGILDVTEGSDDQVLSGLVGASGGSDNSYTYPDGDSDTDPNLEDQDLSDLSDFDLSEESHERLDKIIREQRHLFDTESSILGSRKAGSSIGQDPILKNFHDEFNG